MSEGELRGIETLAMSAPVNATIVEIGSLFGRSSVVWAASSPPGSTIYCIDPWVRESWIIELEKTIPNCPVFGFESFRELTAKYGNIVPLLGYSPHDFTNWDTPVDILFDDAVHFNPHLRNNLRFWMGFMNPGGIICGHDYCSLWPDVVAESHRLATDLGASVRTHETLWWINIPTTFERKRWARSWWKVLLRRY